MNIKECISNIISILIMLSAGLLILGMSIGIMTGAQITKNDGKCKYDSILSRVVFTYWIGCELERPRFKKIEDNK